LKVNAIIVGATGYGGIELIRILLNHPNIRISHLFAYSQDYPSVLEVYSHLNNMLDLPINTLEQLDDEQLRALKEQAEIVFLATPSGVSTAWGPKFLKHGFKVIDLSGDFRLKDPKQYENWYGKEPPKTNDLQKAVYGLTEWFAEDIKQAAYIANPGCYATSILLALAPLFHHRLPIKSIIIDAKSGVSGAGRGLTNNTHFAEVNDNFKTYKVGVHQHIPEIEQTLAQIGGQPVTVQMMTHLIPMTRGILSTIYVDFQQEISKEALRSLYHQSYDKHPFVRLRRDGEYPETKQVYGTNFCDIGLYQDQRTKRLILFSVIDNLMKGAAGQAVQNMNVMMGWDEKLGLHFVPIYP